MGVELVEHAFDQLGLSLADGLVGDQFAPDADHFLGCVGGDELFALFVAERADGVEHGFAQGGGRFLGRGFGRGLRGLGGVSRHSASKRKAPTGGKPVRRSEARSARR